MNFGSITHKDGFWKIACEPHVRTKLKRLFPEVSQRAAEVIDLSDNEENCRDLLWFLQRYPMKVEGLKRMKQRATRHVEQQNQVDQLLSFRRPPEDFVLAKPAREYQTFAAALCKIKPGLLVGDDVGLGKTCTSICLMTEANNLPVLVVTLTHLPKQWEDQIREFAPNLNTHIIRSRKPYDLVPKGRKKKEATPIIFDESRLPDVIIISYSKLSGWAEILGGLVRYVVFDECQELRHDDSDKYAAAKYISDKTPMVMGCSATPIYNYGIEFYNVINALNDGVLGTKQEFIREWAPDGKKIADPKAFGEYLRREGLMIRRTRMDVGRELPPISRIPQYVESDPHVLEKIKGSAIELARIILASNQAYKGEKLQASEQFSILLRQATGIAKAPYVAEFVKLLLESEEKIILFGWHREVYGIWMDLLREFNPRMYTGSESPSQKEESKEAFVNGDCRVLIISLRAGAGLDGLQHVCRTGVIGELDYSTGVVDQCIGRYARDGQTEPSMAYFMLADSGSDPIIADILGIKRGQIEGVMDPDADLIERLENAGGNVRRLAEAYLERVMLTTVE